MNRKQQISLSVPTPCHENWDKMTPNEKGRHCASCNKTVIDFSDYSDRQLIEFFSKLNGSVCGRLTSVQVGRTIEYVSPPRFPFLYKLLFGAAMALGLTSNAQQNAGYLPKHTQPNQKAQPSKKKPHVVPTHCIEGIVKDAATNQPLPYVNLAFLHQGKILGEAQSDSNGHYRFHLSATLKGKEITIVRAYVYENYDDFSQAITLNSLPYHFDVGLSVRKPIAVIAKQELVEPVMHTGGAIVCHTVGMTSISVARTLKQKFSFDLDNPDHTTIRKGDTPYW